MKKTGVLHAELSKLIATLGHGDMLVLGDAGLPVPPHVPCIDLAVTLGIPTLQQVLEAVLEEVYLEKITLAAPTETHSPNLWQFARNYAEAQNLSIDVVSHDELKQLSQHARAIVRTGDTTSYTNIILHSGVPF
ncbi:MULTISPECIES: D-ribose pyranase [unclassified Neisseria]|uniref:D-ribose pyranase n=1 Tax=unclassified Neisseria TaxID=2623750 RepID=UPI002665D3F5|nr:MULTISPECIES: D-ribose pyranase [unclassified Neisseria]MDO1509185.1 D-ribose pyranase [Neisseria sp. MVDL19-042950]MDO1515536.1 D-ribose pyranase [Neisseria sp. MVDL18-041461]MDO1562895.1 D-ribose pyranase [Neisseria sp. MVDL20-010259]